MNLGRNVCNTSQGKGFGVSVPRLELSSQVPRGAKKPGFGPPDHGNETHSPPPPHV